MQTYMTLKSLKSIVTLPHLLIYSDLEYQQMTFGERIVLLRKQMKWSQGDLAKKIGTSAPIVGRYERGEIKPSIEVAVRIADALEVTLDYLLGKSDALTLDKKNLQRLEEIQQLPQEDQTHILYTIDNLIKAAKLRGITAA